MCRARFLLAVLVALLSAGIPSTGADRQGVVFVQHRGATSLIEVDVGQEFALVLESNPSTGYRWELAQPLDETILTFVGSEFRPPATPLPGAPGKELRTFRAVGRGATTISLKYVRPWETDLPPARTATFPVVVR
jgi:inhibitor of cysteine peptidase